MTNADDTRVQIKVMRYLILVAAIAGAVSCGKDAPTYSGPPVAAVNVSAPASNVIIGQTLQLNVALLDINGSPVNGAPVLWQSSSTPTATVTQAGVVTGRAEGLVRIRASSGSAKDSVEITVNTNTYDVNTAGEKFIPASLEIPLGATVRFNMFGDEGHDATFQNVPGHPDNINVSFNEIVSRTFSTRGTFPYDCLVHPGMSGQIIVR